MINCIAGSSRVGFKVWLQNPEQVVWIVQLQNQPWDPALGSLPTGARCPIWAACALPWWDTPRNTVDLPWTLPARTQSAVRRTRHGASVEGSTAPAWQVEVSVLTV